MQIFVGGADTKLVANKSVTQKFEQLTPAEKPERLMKVIMEQPADAKIVVFCNTKADCAKLEADQKRLGRGTCAIDETRALVPLTNPEPGVPLTKPEPGVPLTNPELEVPLTKPRPLASRPRYGSRTSTWRHCIARARARSPRRPASPQGRVPSTATRINGNASARCRPFRPARRPSCSRPTWRREGSTSAE